MVAVWRRPLTKASYNNMQAYILSMGGVRGNLTPNPSSVVETFYQLSWTGHMTSINQGAGEVLPDDAYQLMKGLVHVERRILGTSFNVGNLERQTKNTMARFHLCFKVE